jgi:GGDEF domain-containing protein
MEAQAEPRRRGAHSLTGMAATGSYEDAQDAQARATAGVLAGEDPHARLAEEVCRAERHGTALSCLLVRVDAGDRRHDGGALREQALAYAAGALARQLRRFDRVARISADELLVLLPGADAPRAEVVARRALARLRAVKIETDGERRPVAVEIGLGAWSAGLSAAQLLAITRLTARREEPFAGASG